MDLKTEVKAGTNREKERKSWFEKWLICSQKELYFMLILYITITPDNVSPEHITLFDFPYSFILHYE